MRRELVADGAPRLFAVAQEPEDQELQVRQAWSRLVCDIRSSYIRST